MGGLNPSGADATTVPHELLEPVPGNHLRYATHDLTAGELDRWLRVLSRQEQRCRVVFGQLAARFLRRQAQHRLGFRRLGDYTRERLGISARELQTAAQVVTALTALPRLAAAFDAGTLSWTQVRMLVTVAMPATEAHWVDVAQGRTVRALEALVRQARTAAGLSVGATDAIGAPEVVSPEVTPSRAAGTANAGSGSAERSDRRAARGVMDVAGDEASIDGEPSVRFHLRCPRRVRRQWHRVVELARRMLGGDGPVWRAAEAVAAEGLTVAPVSADAWEPSITETAGAVEGIPAVGVEALRNDGSDATGASGRPPVWECLDWSAVRAALPAEIERLGDDCDRLDAFALDARLRRVLQAQHRIDWQLGRMLHTLLHLRLQRVLGFPSVAAYTPERLGLSPSKVRGLVAIERKTRDVAAFRSAYEAGELSWVRALALLPVLADGTAAAWTARAQAVTVRRLVAEVEWSLDQGDADPAGAQPPGPPPVGYDLAADAAVDAAAVGRQMCARRDGSPADAEIVFAGPASVVALLQTAVAAFRQPGERRWAGFERLLEHVATEWEAQPRHRDPIFTRDGWRCAVPACGVRRNLHDHHLQFRSQGGTNVHGNRVTVCAWHHLRGIHAGVVRASGTAPASVRWELGLRAGQAPLLSFIGETYVSGQTAMSGEMHPRRDANAGAAHIDGRRSAAA